MRFEFLCNFYTLGQQLSHGPGKLSFLRSLSNFIPKPHPKDVFHIQHTVVYRRYIAVLPVVGSSSCTQRYRTRSNTNFTLVKWTAIFLCNLVTFVHKYERFTGFCPSNLTCNQIMAWD